jgi:hypothetical protein
VSAQNAKDAADEFVAQLRLPPESSGRKFQLVTFAREEDCRFFYPRRALDFHRQMNTYISRALRERFKVRVQRIAIAPADYRQWLAADIDRIDMPAMRRQFADAHLRLILPAE